ncbi:MAG: LodA/GoxA family CTQ-dependent oxidase [Pseudomonadota bacterium]
MADDQIVRAAIYPPIGICRVGNSPEDFYIGPEVADPLPLEPGAYRDADGKLKREAARFRIYGLNATGDAVAEITSDMAEIEWQVTLENQKSSWYEFQLALDVPEAATAAPSNYRNASIADRARLNITPGSRTISGPGEHGARYQFADGAFMGTEVYLGELRTDEHGRLIVLGGRGVSANYEGKPATTFANNEGWHDDTSDGPVHARVVLDGTTLEVAGAWVVTAPPNYGPQQKSVRTMWDLQRSLFVNGGWLQKPDKPSFQQDILPILQRMTDLQWVNQGFFAGFGQNAPFNLSSEDWLKRLSDPSDAQEETRRVIANNFRHFDIDGKSPVPWPWIYGDAMSLPPVDSPRQHAALSDLQLAFLEQWAEGDFHPDYDPDYEPPRHLDAVPVADQPDMLTRAAMEFCLADAFHPGCEMTWPMRHLGMYTEPYRLLERTTPEPSLGPVLTRLNYLDPDGPINGGQSPGSITRWMAIPWQTDTSSCRSGYTPTYDPYVPTFWPARVPNEVMSRSQYETVLDTSKPMEDRIAAFNARANWLEPLGIKKPYIHQINHMISNFDEMGVVEVQPGPTDTPDFPAVMQVSDQKEIPQAQSGLAVATAKEAAKEATDLSTIDKVKRIQS